MEFKEISITLPNEVREIYDIIHPVCPNTFIAGGFVYDQFTGFPFKDVDIFTEYGKYYEVSRKLESFGCRLRSIVGEYEMLMVGERGAYEFSYKGIQFQIIFQSIHTEIIEYFDVRIRECYYLNGRTFISTEALIDIENKELHTGIIHDPIKTLHRLIRFEQKYGFPIHTTSLERLFDFMSFNGSKRLCELYSDFEIKNEQEKNRFWDIINHYYIKEKDTFLSFNPEALKYLKDQKFKVKRELFDSIYFLDERYGQTIKYEFDENPFLVKISSIDEEIIQYVKTNSVKFLFHLPEKANEWKKNIDNVSYLHTIFKEDVHRIIIANKHNKSEIVSVFQYIQDLFDKQQRYTLESFDIESETNLTFSSKNAIFSKMEIDEYLNHDYLSVEIGNKGYILINAKTNQFISGNVRKSTFEIYFPIIMKLKKELDESLLTF